MAKRSPSVAVAVAVAVVVASRMPANPVRKINRKTPTNRQAKTLLPKRLLRNLPMLQQRKPRLRRLRSKSPSASGLRARKR
jgi:hypothetical protein